MSAVARPCVPLQRLPMTLQRLDEIVEIEKVAYDFPWSRGNFVDSLAAGYLAQMALDAEDAVAGYWVAMPGVEEMHLLNVTVRPGLQRRGHGAMLLEAVIDASRAHGARSLWLEVRHSNLAARRLYERRGFRPVGVRRGYYPAGGGRREDALVMSLALDEAGDGLD